MFHIHYSIPGQSDTPVDARVAITDMMGRELFILLDEKQMSGEYAIPFEWQRLENGTYYVIVEVAGVRSTEIKTVIR